MIHHPMTGVVPVELGPAQDPAHQPGIPVPADKGCDLAVGGHPALRDLTDSGQDLVDEGFVQGLLHGVPLPSVMSFRIGDLFLTVVVTSYLFIFPMIYSDSKVQSYGRTFEPVGSDTGARSSAGSSGFFYCGGLFHGSTNLPSSLMCGYLDYHFGLHHSQTSNSYFDFEVVCK